jgi:protoporphyrinogen/coproporphyrinogen III oxidase
MRRIAVVGAGAAGLAAAWRLQARGAQVTVYEQRAEPGGRMRTDEIEGIRFDAGVQLLASNYKSTFALAAAAGASALLEKSPGRDAVWRRGKAHHLTYGSVASMITSTALPAGLKFKLGARYLPFLARHSQLDLHNLLNTGGLALDNDSIADWGARELGPDFVDLLAYPLLGAYYGSAPERTSSALYHALARVGLDVAVYGVRGGMGELARAIARRAGEHGVVFRYGSSVAGLELRPDGATVRSGELAEDYDGVLLAVPASNAAQLIAPGPIREWLAGVQTTPTVTLALGLNHYAHADFFGLSIPRAQSDIEGIVAICVQERKSSRLVPAGRGALVVLPAPGSSEQLSDLEPNEVLDRLLPGVERALPGTRSAVLRARTTRLSAGYTIFYPGYLHHLRKFSSLPLPANVALAGDYVCAPTVEGAVRSGEAAADRLLQSIKPRG